MIKILNEAGKAAPVFICDVCNERITETGGAAAVFPRTDQEGALLQVLHVHKGSCHNKAEIALIQESSGAPWQELKHHVVYLLHNSGLDRSALESASDTAELITKFG